MPNKSEKQDSELDENLLENSSRRTALKNIGLLLAGAVTLGVGSAEAYGKKKTVTPFQETDSSSHIDYTSRSRVAQELDSECEIIGQAELNRLVTCQTIVSKTYINPMFLSQFANKRWKNEVLESIRLTVGWIAGVISIALELKLVQETGV